MCLLSSIQSFFTIYEFEHNLIGLNFYEWHTIVANEQSATKLSSKNSETSYN